MFLYSWFSAASIIGLNFNYLLDLVAEFMLQCEQQLPNSRLLFGWRKASELGAEAQEKLKIFALLYMLVSIVNTIELHLCSLTHQK
jgi:hypothetical protein